MKLMPVSEMSNASTAAKFSPPSRLGQLTWTRSVTRSRSCRRIPVLSCRTITIVSSDERAKKFTPPHFGNIVRMVRRRFFLTMAGAAAILRAGDPWTAADVRQPSSLAKQLKDGKKPLVLYVGFPILYKAAHISGAVLAGPGSKQTGLDIMQAALSGVAKDREIILYCGCCPFDHCPNPSVPLLREFANEDIATLVSYVEPGYPV